MKNLRKNFLRELTIRNYSERTINTYTSALVQLSRHFNSSPATLTTEQIKDYLLYCKVRKEYSVSTQKQIIGALKFLFEKVLKKEWEPLKIAYPKSEKRLPVVLSKREISNLLDRIKNLKHKTIISVAYSSGLRIDELCHLCPHNIDPSRMQIRVQQGKGRKDRYTLLSPKVLSLLRKYYKQYQPKVYLFEGYNEGVHISVNTIRKVFNNHVKKAGIKKPVTFHSLRHSFATHLLEQGTNLKAIQQLMGHQSLKTTSIYLHITQFKPSEIISPIETL